MTLQYSLLFTFRYTVSFVLRIQLQSLINPQKNTLILRQTQGKKALPIRKERKYIFRKKPHISAF